MQHQRRIFIFVGALFVLALFFKFSGHRKSLQFRYSGGSLTGEPPSYDALHEWEKNLPQHNMSLPRPEGKNGRYVKFSNQIKALGWNNVLNEILLCTHLAYESKRAYVFQDYYWKPEYYPWRITIQPWENGPRWPQTPINALISGPTAGGPWDDGDSAPRSVNEAYFDQVCPPEDRDIIDTDTIKPDLQDAEGDVILRRWTEVIRDSPKRCVEVVPGRNDNFPQTFDLWLIGYKRLLSLWPVFKDSPTSRLFGTAPLVASAVDRNEYLFMPRGSRPARYGPHDPYERMMALHVRRGDFEEACYGLARWNSTFYGWNQLPVHLDKFTPPPGGSWGENIPENIAFYLEHCYPNFDAIVQKIQDTKNSYINNGTNRVLDVMYLLTNADNQWVNNFKDVMMSQGWSTIVTSKDLVLDDEQIGVNMAVDMEIARKAAVFIGNGWSSFTSNIIHRRLVDDKEPFANRFW
ncbi:hypothetical protein OE88DRAFT_1660494 [Heliocybe sulcata]|uniref:Uncharacterized protein n=1 Tax=Heliocybe sulcata TaxID=5364 RepID=A0A5C3N4U9_9AGAM|nr:hypothetical protein OE88DRAFT_1660494 [Heliocybe sulcata]